MTINQRREELEPTYDSIDDYQNYSTCNQNCIVNNLKQHGEVVKQDDQKLALPNNNTVSSSASSPGLYDDYGFAAETSKYPKAAAAKPNTHNYNSQQFLSPSAASSSVFSSALTSSSILPTFSSSSNSSNSTNESSSKVSSASKNKQNQLKKDNLATKNISYEEEKSSLKGEVYEQPNSASLKYIDESIYEVLSNTNSGTSGTSVVDLKNLNENMQRLNSNLKENCMLFSGK